MTAAEPVLRQFTGRQKVISHQPCALSVCLDRSVCLSVCMSTCTQVFLSVCLCVHGQATEHPSLQAGEPQKAVDCCVLLSQWDQAVQLAQQYNIPQVQALLFKYAAMLLEQGKTMAAVQLYRKVSSERSGLIQGESMSLVFCPIRHGDKEATSA